MGKLEVGKVRSRKVKSRKDGSNKAGSRGAVFAMSDHLKSGAPGTVWTWIMMVEFAMLSSMTGSPRCLFSIQGVSKSQTG